MIPCRKISALMYKDIDGALTKKEAADFKAHLNACPTCEKEYRLVQGIIKTLAEEEKKPLPQGFHQDLMNKLAREETKQLMPLFFRKPSFRYAVTACLAILITVYGFQGNFTPQDLKNAPEDNIVQESTTKIMKSNEESIEKTSMPEETPSPTQPVKKENFKYAGNEKKTHQPKATQDNMVIQEEKAPLIEAQPQESMEPPAPASVPEMADRVEQDEASSSIFAIEEHKTMDQIPDETLRESTVSGGGGSSVAFKLAPTQELYTIRVKGAFDPSKIEGAISQDEYTYQIPMSQLTYVLNLLDGMDYVVENIQGKNSEWFLLIINP